MRRATPSASFPIRRSFFRVFSLHRGFLSVGRLLRGLSDLLGAGRAAAAKGGLTDTGPPPPRNFGTRPLAELALQDPEGSRRRAGAQRLLPPLSQVVSVASARASPASTGPSTSSQSGRHRSRSRRPRASGQGVARRAHDTGALLRLRALQLHGHAGYASTAANGRGQRGLRSGATDNLPDGPAGTTATGCSTGPSCSPRRSAKETGVHNLDVNVLDFWAQR